MKILIIGFQRSGTTLLRRLFHIHPEIQFMIHEKRILNSKNHLNSIRNKKIIQIKNKKNDVIIDVDKHWGEKVPWYTKTGSDIIGYVNKWFKEFNNDSRIIHIKRNVKDVENSNLRTFNLSKRKTNENYKKSLPKVTNKFENDNRYIEIDFEELVTNPKEILRDLFKFCNLLYSEDILDEITSAKRDKLRYFDSINPDRAYAYEKEK